MRNVLMKLLCCSMPITLVLFVISQTMLISIKSQADVLPNSRTISSESLQGVTSFSKIEKTSELKKIPDGLYFTYKEGYSCFRKTSVNAIPSYFDSYQISDGKICHTGDACSLIKNECSVKLPSGLEMAKDYSSFVFEKKTYHKQETSIPNSCVMPACAEPADICQFEEMPPLDAFGCPLGCGTISCKPTGNNCAQLNCAAPPQNCEYDGKAKLGKDGCPLGCGNLICDSISTKEFKCPNINCAKPPENCRYDDSGKLDVNGCKLTCGQIICDRVDLKKPACPPAPHCIEPPAGCSYAGAPAVDKNSCRIGCGSMKCKKNTPPNCKQPLCEPPSEFCRYDGNSPLDFKGCSTGCGNLICNSTK